MSYGGMKLPAGVTMVALGNLPWIVIELRITPGEGIDDDPLSDVEIGADINAGAGISTSDEILEFLELTVEQLRKRIADRDAAIAEEVEQYHTDVEAEAGS
jgi:hypothetical protein